MWRGVLPIGAGVWLAGVWPAQAEGTQAAAANGADTAWVLTATALVLFMTLPGLALFYAGLVRQKNVLSVMMHCVAIACLASVVWFALAYSLAFSGDGPLVGNLDNVSLLGLDRGSLHGTLPAFVFVMFQMTFAIITPALIVGAYTERVRFDAVLLFSALWLCLVYAPVAHWVWGGGWLATRNVMDYAGGLVVHATAGISALLIARAVGPRDGFPRELKPPHNPGMTMMGAGMLWVGWYGFNGGSALAANGDAGAALLATHLSASTAGLVWALIEKLRFGRSSMIGTVTGVVAGLATITPASGYVGPAGAVALGAAGALCCFLAVDVVKHRLRIDDALDVCAVHGIGGILGSLLVSIFASKTFGGVGYAVGGSMAGQFGTQLIGIVATLAWSALGTLAILAVTAKLCGLRADEQALVDGLDLAHHGERAYPP